MDDKDRRQEKRELAPDLANATQANLLTHSLPEFAKATDFWELMVSEVKPPGPLGSPRSGLCEERGHSLKRTPFAP